MLVTIAVIVVVMTAMAAVELWLFWRLGERDERRRIRRQAQSDAAEHAQRRRRGTTDMIRQGRPRGSAARREDDKTPDCGAGCCAGSGLLGRCAYPDGSTTAIAMVIATPRAISASSRYSTRPRRRPVT
jgi:hypothetical protein